MVCKDNCFRITIDDFPCDPTNDLFVWCSPYNVLTFIKKEIQVSGLDHLGRQFLIWIRIRMHAPPPPPLWYNKWFVWSSPYNVLTLIITEIQYLCLDIRQPFLTIWFALQWTFLHVIQHMIRVVFTVQCTDIREDRSSGILLNHSTGLYIKIIIFEFQWVYIFVRSNKWLHRTEHWHSYRQKFKFFVEICLVCR